MSSHDIEKTNGEDRTSPARSPSLSRRRHESISVQRKERSSRSPPDEQHLNQLAGLQSSSQQEADDLDGGSDEPTSRAAETASQSSSRLDSVLIELTKQEDRLRVVKGTFAEVEMRRTLPDLRWRFLAHLIHLLESLVAATQPTGPEPEPDHTPPLLPLPPTPPTPPTPGVVTCSSSSTSTPPPERRPGSPAAASTASPPDVDHKTQSNPLISAQRRVLILRALAFLVHWGILPHVHPAISYAQTASPTLKVFGSPFSRSPGTAQAQTEDAASTADESATEKRFREVWQRVAHVPAETGGPMRILAENTQPHPDQRVLRCVRVLWRVLRDPELGSLVARNFLAAFVLGCVHVACGSVAPSCTAKLPVRQPVPLSPASFGLQTSTGATSTLVQSSSSSSTSSVSVSSASVPLSSVITKEERIEVATHLQDLYDFIPAYQLVPALASLMRAAEKRGQVIPLPRYHVRMCGRMLSACLVSYKHGVSAILSDLVSQSAEGDDQVYWNAIDQLLRVPAPPVVRDKEDYFDKIGVQVAQLLGGQVSESSAENPDVVHLITTVSLFALRFLHVEPSLARRTLLDPLLNVFRFLGRSKPKRALPRNLVEPSSTLLTEAITGLDRLLGTIECGRFDPLLIDATGFLSYCLDLLPGLLLVFAYCHQRKMAFAVRVRQLICTLLQKVPAREAASFLKDALLCDHSITATLTTSTSPDPSRLVLMGGLSLDAPSVCWSLSAEMRCPDVQTVFALFEPSQQLIQAEAEKQTADADSFMMELDPQIRVLMKSPFLKLIGDLFVQLLNDFVSETKSKHYIRLLEALALMSEQFGPAVLSDVVQICTFASVMLSSDNQDLIDLSLALVNLLLSGGVTLEVGEELLIFDMVPQLERLTSHSDADTARLARELCSQALTKDPQWRSASIPSPRTGSSTEDRFSGAATEESIRTVLRDIGDPLLPVRAHGLIALRRLVLRQDEVTLRNLDRVLKIFRAQLHHTDSAIFLSAIRGLGALGDVRPLEIIPLLCELCTDQSLELETRLKLGEVLLLVASRCGDTLPRHAAPMMKVLLAGVRDEECSIRQSSLSNLASMCELLRFAVHPWLHTILRTVCDALALDAEAIVRRGAIFVFVSLLRGLGRDVLEFIPKELLGIHEVLQSTIATDSDEVTRYHAEKAILEMELIVEELASDHQKEDHPLAFLRFVKPQDGVAHRLVEDAQGL